MASRYDTLMLVIRRRLLEEFKKLRVAVKDLASKREVVHAAGRVGAHPDQVARYYILWGSIEEAESFFRTTESSIPKTIRVNTLKLDVNELIKRLESKGVKVRRFDLVPYGLIVEKSPYSSLTALHEYLKGFFHIQGPASMLVVPQLEMESSTVAADLCCGAGGKTTQMAQHNPSAPILAFDLNRRKLLALKIHASRLGVFNLVLINDDARKAYVYGSFDRILLDAPCSGEGLWPFLAKRKARSFEDIMSRVELQLQLMIAALLALKRPGVLVYATCSTAVEENELVISTVLDCFKDVDVVEPDIPVGDKCVDSYGPLRFDDRVVKCRRFYPHKHRMEGFTIFKLVAQ